MFSAKRAHHSRLNSLTRAFPYFITRIPCAENSNFPKDFENLEYYININRTAILIQLSDAESSSEKHENFHGSFVTARPKLGANIRWSSQLETTMTYLRFPKRITLDPVSPDLAGTGAGSLRNFGSPLTKRWPMEEIYRHCIICVI